MKTVFFSISLKLYSDKDLRRNYDWYFIDLYRHNSATGFFPKETGFPRAIWLLNFFKERVWSAWPVTKKKGFEVSVINRLLSFRITFLMKGRILNEHFITDLYLIEKLCHESPYGSQGNDKNQMRCQVVIFTHKNGS